jgi:hypothetical protein
LAALNFQVAAELSAANTPMAVIAIPTTSFVTILRIVFLSFCVECLDGNRLHLER